VDKANAHKQDQAKKKDVNNHLDKGEPNIDSAHEIKKQ